MTKLYDVLTEQEQDTLRKLQAKAKKVQRQDKAFWQWVDDHADVIKDRLGVSESTQSTGDWWDEYQTAMAERDKYKALADEYRGDLDKLAALSDQYGCSLQELWAHISSPGQISYYRKYRGTAQVYPTTD